MALNWLRGFRRLGWVLIVSAGIVVAFFVVDVSKEVVGFDPELVKANFPNTGDPFQGNPFTPQLTVKLLELERTGNDQTKLKSRLHAVCEDSDFNRLPSADKELVLRLNSFFARHDTKPPDFISDAEMRELEQRGIAKAPVQSQPQKKLAELPPLPKGYALVPPGIDHLKELDEVVKSQAAQEKQRVLDEKQKVLDKVVAYAPTPEQYGLLQECDPRVKVKYEPPDLVGFQPLYDIEQLRSTGKFPYASQVEVRRVNPWKFLSYVCAALIALTVLVQGGISLVA